VAVRRRRSTKGRKRDPRLKRAGVSGFNKPKRTPGHKTKSHIVQQVNLKLASLVE